MQGSHDTRTLGAAGRSDAGGLTRAKLLTRRPTLYYRTPKKLFFGSGPWTFHCLFSAYLAGRDVKTLRATGLRRDSFTPGTLGCHGQASPGFARGGGRRRVPPELGTTLIAITVVFLVESLIGPTWTVLGFCLALGIAASRKSRLSTPLHRIGGHPGREHARVADDVSAGVRLVRLGLAPPVVPGRAVDQLAAGGVAQGDRRPPGRRR